MADSVIDHLPRSITDSASNDPAADGGGDQVLEGRPSCSNLAILKTLILAVRTAGTSFNSAIDPPSRLATVIGEAIESLIGARLEVRWPAIGESDSLAGMFGKAEHSDAYALAWDEVMSDLFRRMQGDGGGDQPSSVAKLSVVRRT